MAELVYALCAITSIVCMCLLTRAYLRSKIKLLLWSALGFAGLALNNLLLFLDLVLLPEMDLSVWRLAAALAGMVVLVFGLVWNAS